MTWDRPTEDDDLDAISIRIHANALLLSLSDVTIQCLMEMALQFVEYSRFMRHRRHRPQEGILENPTIWWRHAGGCVIREIGKVCSMRRYVSQLSHRRTLRQQYHQLYRRYRKLKRWSWILVPLFGTEKSALHALRAAEQCLSTLEVAEFRWWSWTQYKQQTARKFPFDNVKTRLIEIYNLLSAEAAVADAAEKWKIDTHD